MAYILPHAVFLLNTKLTNASVWGDKRVLKCNRREHDLVVVPAVGLVNDTLTVCQHDLPVFVGGASGNDMNLITWCVDLQSDAKGDEFKISGFHSDIFRTTEVNPIASRYLLNRINVCKVFW
jgi:hypothetical protein